MKLRNKLSHLIKKLTFQEYSTFKKNACFPSGHYYSPIVSVDDIKHRQTEIWNNAEIDGINGIDLSTEKQIKLIDSFTKYYDEIPFKPIKQANVRYQYENDYYSYTDGIILYSMLRHFAPKKVIEIGSGFSSAVMLDTNEFFFR